MDAKALSDFWYDLATDCKTEAVSLEKEPGVPITSSERLIWLERHNFANMVAEKFGELAEEDPTPRHEPYTFTESEVKTILGEPTPQAETRAAPETIRIIFDGPPGPHGCEFVEVETLEGVSINVGEWEPVHPRRAGHDMWQLTISSDDLVAAVKASRKPGHTQTLGHQKPREGPEDRDDRLKHGPGYAGWPK